MVFVEKARDYMIIVETLGKRSCAFGGNKKVTRLLVLVIKKATTLIIF